MCFCAYMQIICCLHAHFYVFLLNWICGSLCVKSCGFYVMCHLEYVLWRCIWVWMCEWIIVCVSEGNWRMKGGLGGVGGGYKSFQSCSTASLPGWASCLKIGSFGFLETHSRRVRREGWGGVGVWGELGGRWGPGLIATNWIGCADQMGGCGSNLSCHSR